MNFKIVADSSCDLTEVLKKELDVTLVPLKLQIGDYNFIDDESLDIQEYIKTMNESPVAPKTACPSPQDFMNAYEGDESVFVVTLSKELSGTYQSAIIAKDMYLEEHPNKFIHVFNTRSASSGETLVTLKIDELAKAGKTELEIVEEVEAFIDEMQTFFLLESLEHLAKSGRLNPIIAKIASFLSIKVIAGASEEGNIKMVEKVRGYKKAFRNFVDVIGKEGKNLSQKTLIIAQCNCPERAEEFKAEVLKKYDFKDVKVVPMKGLSSTYADDGGLVIAF